MFKKLKITDYVIILFIVLFCIIGTLAVFKKKHFANLPIEKEVKINFEVFFRGITMTTNQTPFVVGDEAFITIRNVPYTKLKIVDFDGATRITAIPDSKSPEGFKVVPDLSSPNMFDFVVRLEDTAKKTADGYVAGGNKIKMGIPVVIEGQTYKYTGTISNVFELPEQQEEPEPQEEPISEED